MDAGKIIGFNQDALANPKLPSAFSKSILRATKVNPKLRRYIESPVRNVTHICFVRQTKASHPNLWASNLGISQTSKK